MSTHAAPGAIIGVTSPHVATRVGLKGTDAAAWLAQQGVRVPANANQVTHWHGTDSAGSGRCLRQGNTEFLIEFDESGRTLAPPPAGTAAWTLIRSDFSLVLTGDHWSDALAQITSFDLQRLRNEPDLLVMTQLAGIGVTLVREPAAEATFALRLWCDASYGPYLLHCLDHLARPAHPLPGESR